MGKRLFDLICATVMTPFALPAVVVLMLVIRMESRGSPLFIQRRIGRNLKEFSLFKLRTMRDGTENLPSHELTVTEITGVGRLLRRTKLDELPQILNIILGDMSFVGPRPCLPNQQELIAERKMRGVYSIRPGITGPAQLAGIDMSTPRELAIADAGYVADHNWRRDIRILLATAFGKGSGDAVGRTC